MPDSCTPVFNILITTGQISSEDIWSRIRLALEAGNTGVARHISRYLPDNQALNEQKLKEAAKDPQRYLEKYQHDFRSRFDREIALFALSQLLRSGINQAYARWHKIHKQFPESDQSYFMSTLAYRAALKQDPRALGWFLDAANSKQAYPLTEAKLAWKTRVTLREGKWDLVMQCIDSMPSAMQQTDVWRYWKARALKTKGELVAANEILAPLSHEHSYYGQMAKEELGVMLSVPAANYQSSMQEISDDAAGARNSACTCAIPAQSARGSKS